MSNLKLSHLVGLIAEEFGWEADHIDRRSKGGHFDRIQVTKPGKKRRSLFFDGERVFICQAKTCDHNHKHEVSIHDPLFEETVRSWFPFFEDRDDHHQWVSLGRHGFWWVKENPNPQSEDCNPSHNATHPRSSR